MDTMSFLRELGSPAELRELAAKGYAPADRPRVNAHVHMPPNFSAFESVPQALDLATDQGIGVLCASNYYYYDVYADFAAGAAQRGIFPLFGTEVISLVDDLVRDGVKVNDPGNPGRMYMCGKGVTRFEDLSDRAAELLGFIRTSDRNRMAEMTRKLAVIFAERGCDTGLTAEGIVQRVCKRHGCRVEEVILQERHIAQAFQEVLFEKTPEDQRAAMLSKVLGVEYGGDPTDAVKAQGQIRSHLMKAGKSAFVTEQFVSFEQARELILELGGIPCYPTLADGADPICPFESPVETLIENVKQRGLSCVEFIPIRNQPDVLRQYVTALRAAGLAVAGGTEHNTLDLLPIEPTCVGGAAVPEEVKAIFWEGACVMAAHQFLVAHGECGFVDNKGEPNSKYADAESRIESFAKLGAAVIQRYYDVREQPAAG